MTPANSQQAQHDLWEIKTLERFANFVHPTPVDKEVSWDKTRIIMSKTDAFGVIEYANDTFIDVSGYEEHELMGMPHSIVRHPDMPKVLFKVLWDNLKQGVGGRYYWVVADFEIKRNDAGVITHYYSRRKAVAPEVVAKVEALYRKLLQIEQNGGMAASEKYLM
ncbi:MAG: PAS domain S-box protein, partial [Chitinophagia bacterium]|nr:PAS domain S-box protein [Chitinophagia bacterium]